MNKSRWFSSLIMNILFCRVCVCVCVCVCVNEREREREREREDMGVIYKTIYVINIIIYMFLQHCNTL